MADMDTSPDYPSPDDPGRRAVVDDPYKKGMTTGLIVGVIAGGIVGAVLGAALDRREDTHDARTGTTARETMRTRKCVSPSGRAPACPACRPLSSMTSRSTGDKASVSFRRI